MLNWQKAYHLSLNKLDTINKSTRSLDEVIKESKSENNNTKALPNSFNFSESMREILGSLMNSRNSLKITQDESGQANILGVPIQISGAHTIRINEIIYELTPETYKALSSTTYTGKTMKNEDDIILMYNIIRDLGYTGIGDRQSNRKTFSTITLPILVEEIQIKTFDEITDNSDDLHGEGVKIDVPSNIIDENTKLEVLLGLKLSSQTDTPTEASNQIHELYKRGEIQNEQQYRNALDKFSIP